MSIVMDTATLGFAPVRIPLGQALKYACHHPGGNTDADYMCAICRAGVEYFEPKGLITSHLYSAIYGLLADCDEQYQGETPDRHTADDLPSAMRLLALQS